MEWSSVDPEVGGRQEFYWLWILATTAYGVGDIVTTVALVFYAPAVREGNPLVAVALQTFGLGGLIALKLVVFFSYIGLSVYAMHVWKDRFLYVVLPLSLAIVGGVLTILNLSLLVRG